MSSIYYDVHQVAERLGITVKTVRNRLARGEIRGRKNGSGRTSHWRVNSMDLAEYEKTEMPYNDSELFDNGRR